MPVSVPVARTSPPSGCEHDELADIASATIRARRELEQELRDSVGCPPSRLDARRARRAPQPRCPSPPRRPRRRPVHARGRASALMRALSRNVAPSSTGSSGASSSAISQLGSAARSSRSLFSLREARTSLTGGGAAAASACAAGERADPARGEVEQRVEELARERLALGGRLHLDETRRRRS